MAQITLNSTGVASNGSLLLQSNGTTTAVTVDASQNVGIGTTPPTSTDNGNLTIKGSNTLNFSTASGSIAANATWNGGWKYISTAAASLYAQAAGTHAWSVASSGTAGNTISFTQAMTLDASGNLGVGTTSPANKLDVVASGDVAKFGNTKKLFVSTDSAGFGLFSAASQANTGIYASDTSNFVYFATSSAERMRIDSSGNVGIGTSSPARLLHISGGGSATYFQMSNNASGNTNADGFQIAQDGANVDLINRETGYMGFNTSNSERARIDSSGNLLVGTTSSSVTSGNGIKLIPGTGSACNIVGAADTNANFALTVYSTSPSAYRFQVGYGGTIYATSTSITAISDASLKTNVRDLETGLTEVMALQPRRFDWINGDASNVAGFIAQEVKQVLPDLVEDYQYSDEETKLGLKMGDILPTLVKAIQEQQALIQTLTARITALEGA